MARRPLAPDADHRAAYMAGRNGRQPPPGVAAKRHSDPTLKPMYDAGKAGTDYDEALKTHAPTVHAQTHPPPAPEAPSPAPPARRSSGRSGLRRPSRPSLRRPLGGATQGADVPHTLGGILIGGVLYALVLSVVHYGAGGPLLWFKAKFLNEPAPAPGARRAAVG